MSTEDEQLFGKKALVEISHAIERFALAAEPGSPLVVIAMFQKLSYFAREVDVYREIAARRAVTLVGLAEDYPPELPPGVRHTLLDAAHPLAREWSVTVLGPSGGATLVAVDQESLDPNAHTIEEGRRFLGRWSFRRADAYAQILRLRAQLKMSADTAAQIDAVLRAVLDDPEPLRQDWWEVPLRFLGDRMDGMIRERASAVAALEEVRDNAAERDPRTGLYTGAFLERWTRGLGSGTLPIGLVLLRVFGVAQLRSRYGLRAELAVLQGLREGICGMLRPTDRMIRLGHEDFLVVLPSWASQEVLRLADEVCAHVSTLDQLYPFVALPAAAVATVTRERPLPVQRLVSEVQSEPRLPVPA
ncbi:MAG: diguanylate cyclase [Pseudonocardiales bacterium]|nr:diguanylate cyclase [Pseudonocardiales bacterium]